MKRSVKKNKTQSNKKNNYLQINKTIIKFLSNNNKMKLIAIKMNWKKKELENS